MTPPATSAAGPVNWKEQTMSEGKKDPKDFVVKDKRRLAGSETASEEPQEPDKEPVKESAQGAGGASDTRLPKIDFATFIFSLNSAVLVHLGIVEDPATGTVARNLPLAKQTIDLLGMLEEKTRGNLDSDEENMLKNILYDLRIRYVRETA
jgi:hypothetical protein